MLEEVGEPLCSVGRLERHARGHRSCDQEELPFDGRRHTAGTPPDDRVEPPDRPLETLHHGQIRHGQLGAPSIPVLRQQDDLSHGPMMRVASDTTPEGRVRYATRTEFTGARCSLTVNQDAPASPDPNKSPDVAPK